MKCSDQRETVRGFVSIVSPFIIASAILFAGLTRGTAPASGASGPPTMSSDLSTEEEVQLSKIATKVFGLPSNLEGRFPGAFGGIRAIDNSTLVIGLVIESAELVGPIQGTLKDMFPEIAFTFVKPASSYATVGRFSDSAPWNGGDALAFALFGSAHLRCTSGPGAHNASGARFLLSAGHCGSLTYFNTSFGNPLLNNPVGSTSASIFADGYPDVQIISTNSSRFFWEGPGNGVRRTTQAGVDPIVGYSVCGQGMTTAAWGGTNCGVITQVNRSDTPVIDASSGVTHVAGAFIWDGSASLNGDSGGYIRLSTIYGYGAVGTITSSNPNGSPPYSVGTPIAFHNFIWGLALNTPSNP